MRKINSSSLFPLIALTLLIFALSQQIFDAPPLGKLLDPFIGAVQNGESRQPDDADLTIDGMGLINPVHIYFDKREVPHIYAQNTADLYFAQGYVTAYLRLWQMDFLSYAAAGRLSEIFRKPELLDYDRTQRRIGMLDAAKRSLEIAVQDPETDKALTAYTKGVNAYIRQLDYKKMPLEYKLLDYKPEPWSRLKSVLMSKNMANQMTGYEEDLYMSKMMLALGEEDFNILYPDFNTHSTPVMNSSRPDSLLAYTRVKQPAYLNYSFLSARPVVTKSSYNPALGSNSWAVSGEKTKSGFPILASDPHLSLSLPCIWLEMQLSAPGMNVYGVSIPGTPAVIIGFNENIAWGITNGADDVKDWYKLKISTNYNKYELDGKWLDLSSRIEEIRRKGQVPFYDTVYSTIHGPVVYNKSFPGTEPDLLNNALKWELHTPSNEMLTFIKLNKASNYQQYKEAISHYGCPLQNFTFACKDNTIAINHQGSMAVKWQGEGRFILDGTNSAHIYTRYIPADSLPQLLNPGCNYVLSANQHPTYSNYPYYYNGYYMETRANRIRQLLEKEDLLDIPAMEAIQLDNVNTFAVDALPILQGKVHTSRLNKEQQQALTALLSWKGTYNAADEYAKLYEMWWENIEDYTWDEFDSYQFYRRSPDDYVLLDLIKNNPSSHYFDKQGTVKKEDAGDIITNSLLTALNDFGERKKNEDTHWSAQHKVNIMHLTSLPAFSKMRLPAAGHPATINATSRGWGPSWRMIVELGDRPKAYGVYPGGQSGNVGSKYYDDFIGAWNKGSYYPLDFFMSTEEAKAHTAKTLTLK